MSNRMPCFAALLAAYVLLAGCGGGDSGGAPNQPGPPPIDSTPDAFEVTDVDGAEPGETYEVSVTVSGIDDGVVIQANFVNRRAGPYQFLVNGEQKDISDGSSHDVVNGDVVSVRMTASTKLGETVSGDLLLASEAVSARDTFEVTTKPDIEPPELAVHFPPPVSMTDTPLDGPDSARLRIRGTATDLDQVSVKVNGVDAELDEASGEWAFDYEILAGDNHIEIVATDEFRNETSKTLTLKHVHDMEDGTATIGTGVNTGPIESVMWDSLRSRMILGGATDAAELDLATGHRRELPGMLPMKYGLFHDVENDRYVAAYFDGLDNARVYVANPELDTAEVISDKNDGGPTAGFDWLRDMASSPDGNRLFAAIEDRTSSEGYLWELDGDPSSSTFGSRAKYSNEKYGTKVGLALDAARNRLLIGDCSVKTIDLGAPVGSASVMLVPASENFCVRELTVIDDTLWARHHTASSDKLLKGTLTQSEFEAVSDLRDRSLGPVVVDGGDMGKMAAIPDLDIVFMPFEVSVGGGKASEAVAAIDARSGYRVFVVR